MAQSSDILEWNSKSTCCLLNQVSVHRLPCKQGLSCPCSLCLPQLTPFRNMQINPIPPLTLSFKPNSTDVNWESCFNRPPEIPARTWGWLLREGMALLGVRDAQCSTSTAWLCLPAQHTDLELFSHCPPAHSTAALHKPPPTKPAKTISLILVQGCTSMFGNARQFLNVTIWADCGQQSWGKSSKDKQELVHI